MTASRSVEKIASRSLSKMVTGFGVYVHWPYCSQICSYCNFNKYRQTSEIMSSSHLETLEQCYVKQVRRVLQRAQYPLVTSVYFGGGTPSLAPVSTISRILETIRDEVGVASGAEITLEVNPTINIVNELTNFKKVGVTRVSIGTQSLNDNVLKQFLYRNHTAQEAQEVIARACDVFEGHVNVDLMFGLPTQSIGETLKDTDTILTCFPKGVNHISLYQLTLERGTEMHAKVKSNEWTLPGEELTSTCYTDLIKLLERYDFEHYEVSNFSRRGFQSIHNLNYWLGGNYVGVGPGVHSCYQNPHKCGEWVKNIEPLTPKHWIRSVMANGGRPTMEKSIGSWERLEEVLCSSLRTTIGFTKKSCDMFTKSHDLDSESCDLYTASLPQYIDIANRLRDGISDIVCKGYISIDNDGIRTSRKGRMVLDSMLPRVLLEMEKIMKS